MRDTFESLYPPPAGVRWSDDFEMYVVETPTGMESFGEHNKLFEVWSDAAKPTHYAVIDDGHIVHAVPAGGLEDGKIRCQRFINGIGDDLPEAKDWTVKGVTVHG